MRRAGGGNGIGLATEPGFGLLPDTFARPGAPNGRGDAAALSSSLRA